MMKILVLIDTNKLGKFKSGAFLFENFNYLDTNKDLLNVIFKQYKDNKNITFGIPQLVFEELISEQKLQFIVKLDAMKKSYSSIYGIPGFSFNIPDINYTSYLQKMVSAFVTKYCISLIQTPINININELVQKALNKSPPFGKKNKGDAGIKDELIWQSILRFVEGKRYDHYFFLSEDCDFEDDLLKGSFKYTTGKDLEIIKDIGQLKSRLDELLTKNNKSIKVLEGIMHKHSELLSLLKKLHTTFIDDSHGEIYEWKRFEIIDVRQVDGDFGVTLEFEIVNSVLV